MGLNERKHLTIKSILCERQQSVLLNQVTMGLNEGKLSEIKSNLRERQ